MSDTKKPGPIDDIDWDEALAEWDGKNFAPKIADDRSDRPPPEPAVSRRLYKPPSMPPQRVVSARPPRSTRESSPAPMPDEEPTRSTAVPASVRGEPLGANGSGTPNEESLEFPVTVDPYPFEALADDVEDDALELPPTVWPDERPASAWLDEAARTAMEERAEWLEHEARARSDKIERARGLLVCSELAAILGERERAYALTVEARELAPTVALSLRQARALMPWPPDPDDAIESLDAEARMGPPGAPRLHSMLLAVDALRTTGSERDAETRIDDAARVAPGDARVSIALAVRALSGPGATAIPRSENAHAVAVADAVGVCMLLRGHELEIATPPALLPNLLFLRARRDVERGDFDGASATLARLTQVPELALGALWLAAALAATRASSRLRAAQWSRELFERGETQALRPLIARLLELGDTPLLSRVLMTPGGLTSAERLVLASLVGSPPAPDDPHMDAAAATPGMLPLVFAVEAIGADRGSTVMQRGIGSRAAQMEVAAGRLLAKSAPLAAVDELLQALGETGSPGLRGAALEVSARAGRWDDVSRAVEAWAMTRASDPERALGVYAAGMLALRGASPRRALEAFGLARSLDPSSEAVVRVVASLRPTDLAAELDGLAAEWGEGVRAALARIEAVERNGGQTNIATCLEELERAYEAAPAFPLAPFIAERIARRLGHVDEALTWMDRRRGATKDPVLATLETVREALWLERGQPDEAAQRWLEAHTARPSDVALRERYERTSADPLPDRGAWLEKRAAENRGAARVAFALEAAREYERNNDPAAALRCAAAFAESSALARLAAERAEIAAGEFARLADRLIAAVKEGIGDATAEREHYERLAALDGSVRRDLASALLWHRTLLERFGDHLPSLRYVEHHFIGEGRGDELEPVASAVARSQRGTGPGEGTAHAELAARLSVVAASPRDGASHEMIRLAVSEGGPSLWALRAAADRAREEGDDLTLVATLKELAARMSNPSDAASLLNRAAGAALRFGDVDEARTLFEVAAGADPDDARTWSFLAELRMRVGDAAGAAEAFEAIARSSSVEPRRLSAWYEAGRLWADIVGDPSRAVAALEAVDALDPDHADVVERLLGLYVARHMHAELADLLERRMLRTTDGDERVAIEVRRGRVLVDLGDVDRARRAFEAVLEAHPDHADALSALADLCINQGDWPAAEQALVRLARLLPSPEEQRTVYVRLAELYSQHLPNLARAEVALKEILRRTPNDVDTIEKLVDIHTRQNDAGRAIELQQELVGYARDPGEKKRRLLDLASLHEHAARDPRRAERTLDAARREFPADLGLLRELAEFYQRHQQTPAARILLDRAAGDARRALAGGQVSSDVFETLATVFDLRGKRDGGRVARNVLATLEARPANMRGAGERAFDPQLDDLLAPEALSSALRALLAKAGEALDVAAPLNVRDLRAVPARPDSAIGKLTTRLAAAAGLGGLQVLISPRLDKACVPVSSQPPTVVLGESLEGEPQVGAFLVVRALKLVQSRASALVRIPAADLSLLVAAWLKCFHPTWKPKWIPAATLESAQARVKPAIARNLDASVGILALEAAGAMENGALPIGTAAIEWADRVSWLALGDLETALSAIGGKSALEPTDRAAWLARTPEALSLVSFAVSDACTQARARLSLDA